MTSQRTQLKVPLCGGGKATLAELTPQHTWVLAHIHIPELQNHNTLDSGYS